MLNNLYKTQGGVLLYILIVGVLFAVFVSIIMNIFSVSLGGARQMQFFLQKDSLAENIVDNLVFRYKNNPQDPQLLIEQNNYNHFISRFSDSAIYFLNNNISSENSLNLSFNSSSQESYFIKYDELDLYPNVLEYIQTWNIFWNMKKYSDAPSVITAANNSVNFSEQTNLKIALTRTGVTNSFGCFITNWETSLLDSNFNNGVQLIPTQFHFNKEDDPLTPDVNEFVECGGAISDVLLAPLDLINFDYNLQITGLNSPTHVLIQAEGNSGFIPTNILKVEVVPKEHGKSFFTEIEL